MLLKTLTYFSVIVFVFIITDCFATKGCWWSFCQSQSWNRKGCQPEHLYIETQSRPCHRGVMHHCCPTSNVTNYSSVVEKGTSSDINTIDTSGQESGICSWYGSGDVPQGALTASGEHFDRYAMKAAHKTLPFGTKIRVTNLKTKKTIDVVINDRGPFMPRRILDLTFAAFGAVENRDKGLFHCSYIVLSLPY